jgi:hypothetical protein
MYICNKKKGLIFNTSNNTMSWLWHLPDIVLAESVEVAWEGQLALGGEHTVCRKTKQVLLAIT